MADKLASVGIVSYSKLMEKFWYLVPICSWKLSVYPISNNIKFYVDHLVFYPWEGDVVPKKVIGLGFSPNNSKENQKDGGEYNVSGYTNIWHYFWYKPINIVDDQVHHIYRSFPHHPGHPPCCVGPMIMHIWGVRRAIQCFYWQWIHWNVYHHPFLQ